MARWSSPDVVIRRVLSFVFHNRVQLTVDAAILLSWMIVSVAVFRWLELPQWFHYLVLFVGVGVYSSLTPTWERPAHNPNN